MDSTSCEKRRATQVRKTESTPMGGQEENKWPKRLRLLRERRGWSQEQAAKELAVSTSAWSHWEQGVVMPHRQLQGRLKQAMREARGEA